MTAGHSQQNAAAVSLFIHLCFSGAYQLTELQQQQVGLCHLCNGPVQNGTAVSQLCSASAGLIDGRCCLLQKENNIRDADYVIGLDLSNCSLSRVEDLQDAFNATTVVGPAQTTLSVHHTGPGFFQCRCVDDFRGYKCLREGEFPIVQVFGPLAGSTVLVSILLWFTQRRKAISV